MYNDLLLIAELLLEYGNGFMVVSSRAMQSRSVQL